MANFIVSYDLNGSHPSHAEMDEYLEKIGAARARILESVWYVGAWMTREELTAYIRPILSQNDRLIVSEATDASFVFLLVDGQWFINVWNYYRQ